MTILDERDIPILMALSLKFGTTEFYTEEEFNIKLKTEVKRYALDYDGNAVKRLKKDWIHATYFFVPKEMLFTGYYATILCKDTRNYYFYLFYSYNSNKKPDSFTKFYREMEWI